MSLNHFQVVFQKESFKFKHLGCSTWTQKGKIMMWVTGQGLWALLEHNLAFTNFKDYWRGPKKIRGHKNPSPLHWSNFNKTRFFEIVPFKFCKKRDCLHIQNMYSLVYACSYNRFTNNYSNNDVALRSQGAHQKHEELATGFLLACYCKMYYVHQHKGAKSLLLLINRQ